MLKTAPLTFTDQLNLGIERACAWLQTMNVEGGYRGGERLSPDKPGELPNELDPVSVLATGYATHLFSWLYKSRDVDFHKSFDIPHALACARQSADWLTNRWALHLMLPATESSQRFMDLGIAGRALFAAYKALHRADYWDVAISIGARMVDFQTSRGVNQAVLPIDETLPAEWSNLPGAYQLKPAMLWKIVHRIPAYEDLGLLWFNAPLPPEVQPLPNRRPKAELAVLQAAQRQAADELHPAALLIEALLMSDNSSERAGRLIAGFNQRVNCCRDWIRTDVLAQQIRLHFATGGKIKMGTMNRLLAAQHPSGGFHFSHGRELSPELSTVATVFAIQALAMAVDEKLARLPGPYGRRDLAIV